MKNDNLLDMFEEFELKESSTISQMSSISGGTSGGTCGESTSEDTESGTPMTTDDCDADNDCGGGNDTIPTNPGPA